MSVRSICNLRPQIRRDQICDARKQSIPGLIDVSSAKQSTLLAPHQSEAAFVGERSFSKSWGLRASGSFFPLPLPRLSSQLSRRTRAETLATQARRLADLVFTMAARVMADEYAIFKISSALFILRI